MEYELIAPILPGFSLFQQVLVNRGIKAEDIPHFINPSAGDLISPLKIDNIQRGVQVLITHIQKNDYALIVVDSDADGYTSSAILLNYLNRLFPTWVQNNVDFVVHDSKVHGLADIGFSDKYKLVIAPDAASNDYEQHKLWHDNGADVLVIDHHLCDKVSEDAIVLNNQICDYPNKTLSGAGMVLKFCSYIDDLLHLDYSYEFADLAALGLVADMVSTQDFETRFLIDLGLDNIQNPFLVEMVDKQSKAFEKGATPEAIAFYVAPFINAVTRVGTHEEKELLFNSFLEYKADTIVPSTKRGCKGQEERLVEQSVRTCTNVKARQKKTQDAGLEFINGVINEKNLLQNKIILILLEDEETLGPGMAGLVANQLVSQYHRPTMILKYVPQTDTWEGSCRGYEKSKLKDFRAFLLSTGLVQWAEGHENAFGACIRNQDIDTFLPCTNVMLADVDFSPAYQVDNIYLANSLQPEEVCAIGVYDGLWAQNVEEPLFAIEYLKLSKDTMRWIGAKGDTLRIDLPNKISFIKFRVSEEEKAALDPGIGYISLNVIGKFKINEWNGYQNPQVVIEDYEIVRKVAFEF